MTYDRVLAVYGDPHEPDFEAKHIVSFELPYRLVYNVVHWVTTTRAHRLAVPKFIAAFTEIRDLGLAHLATEYAGIYENRSIRAHPKHLSAHAWGCAIDLNASRLPLGSFKREDARIVRAFTRQGFLYGGDFHSRLDPMHYSLLGF